jgi:acyl carrier protein
MTQDQIEAWLTKYVSKLLRVRSEDVDVDMPFEQYGLDSTAAVGLSADLSDLLGIDLADDLAYRFQTIRSLAEHLAGLRPGGEDG